MQNFTMEVIPATSSTETPVRRSVLTKGGELVNGTTTGCNTVLELLTYSCKAYNDKNFLGQRKLLDTIKEKKVVETTDANGNKVSKEKTWVKYKLSGYEWMTYNDVYEYSKYLSFGLTSLGICKGDRVTIYSNTCREWMIAYFSTAFQGIEATTAYSTLGESGLAHSVKETKSKLIYVHTDTLEIGLRVASEAPDLKTIVYFGDLKDYKGKASIDEAKGNGLKVLHLDELHKLGKESENTEINSPAPDDVAMIMYTSGSTGNPKGVVMTHRNVTSVVGGLEDFIGAFVTQADLLLSYLPLAHVLEFTVELLAMHSGVPLGYGTVRTLTSENTIDCYGDMQELKPTVMVGVPQVWDTIRANVLRKIEGMGPIKSRVFKIFTQLKHLLRSRGVPTAILDNYVFSQAKAITGGKLRFAITGGAPISLEARDFITNIICPLIQGYGLTESSGLISVQIPGNIVDTSVGLLISSTEVKLLDAGEVGYDLKDGIGEICIRGNTVFRGYLDNPEETQKAFTEDGWFRTGDIGYWSERGELRIVDRLKNLVKLANGEYIAIEMLESLYKLSLFVDNICVYADPLRSNPVAFVSVNRGYLSGFAASNGISYSRLDELCQHKDVLKAMHDRFNQIGSANKLNKSSYLSDIYVTCEVWSPENGLLTAASKLNRRKIFNTYSHHFDKL
ncbi:Long-chain-fatty-acid-CoA ligase 1 [Zancudomyces culisetae]|uniref:Long-chain-fatty-acid-CoA ligase 1 n=1 Tax=Zancudomyces culisetae TaxID=1213189 RepID=A0A1R1PNP6_ZANCU|nr:Long-chain-fatty-acid-CoA ligase 1 [Zancudomyces culisetae]|eukprot:OMH82595.1 Long-chain-fatty-acid-CoA ligase 1 [Zancudomyces culisetae]